MDKFKKDQKPTEILCKITYVVMTKYTLESDKTWLFKL